MTVSTPRLSHIGQRFELLAEQNRPGFVPYITAGYPSLAATGELMSGLAELDADVIELGVPFSDPMADGPTIQWSSQQALDAGTSTEDVFQVLSDFRRRFATPVVLFSYLNPVYAKGVEAFTAAAVQAGADGLLATDLPLGADPDLEAAIEDGPLDLIRLIAPTTTRERIPDIAGRSQGFVYYISRTGVTGTGASLSETLAEDVGRIRSVSPRPVAVGFGISTPEQAAIVGRCADGAVVGSALVNALREGGVEAAHGLASRLRKALDTCRDS